MDALTRLTELCQQQKRAQAEIFAREILQRDPVENVTGTTEEVTVETQHFTGTHPVTTLNGRLVVQGRGTYHLKPEVGLGELSFTTATVPDCVREPAQDALNHTAQAERVPQTAVSD